MDDFVKLIKECSFIHPACTMNFTELTRGLFTEVANDNVNVNYHPEFPHLAIFKYSRYCVTEKNWNKFTIIARGLILDLKNKKVISVPFVKFFNYDEIAKAQLFIEPEFTVLEKLDGSLGILFFFADEFRFATVGSFVSDQAKWARTWSKKHMPLDKIDKNNTYLFEIIYCENKIVVNYDFEGLVLLSIFDSYGLEYKYEQIKRESEYIETRCTREYSFEDMNSILNKVQTLDKNNEGYVIRFKSGMRLKIKGDEYVRVHKLLSQVTPIALWEIILKGDDLEVIRKELPEEMKKDFEIIIKILHDRLKIFIKEVEDLYNKTKSMTDKELGICMRLNPEYLKGKEFKETIKFIFPMRQNKFYKALEDHNSFMRRKIFKAFRPKSNVLNNYTPSSVTNRFSDINN